MSRLFVGSLLLLAACIAEPEVEVPIDPPTDPVEPTEPTEPTDPVASDEECQGEEVAPESVRADVVVATTAAGGSVQVTIHNDGSVPLVVEPILHINRGRLAAPAITVPPGQAASPALLDLGNIDFASDLPNLVKVELIARDGTGTLIERTFAHGHVGPTVADTAGRLGLATTVPVDGEPAVLAAIGAGGRGLDASSLLGANDDLDVTAPVVPGPGSFNMCFRWPVTLIDAGFGEDYGTDPTSPWVARGGRVKIEQGGAIAFEGYLDTAGCTGTFASIGTTDFKIFGFSRARIAGNDLIVRDSMGMMRAFVIADADPASQNPVFVFPEVQAVSTMLAVTAYTLAKQHSGMTGKTIPVENRCRPVANGCCNCSSGDAIWVTSPGRKFLIAHEMGHRLLSLKIGGYNNDVSFDLDPTNVNNTCDTSSTHSMWSMENESGAAMEGWAHFIAVATFNDRAGTNAAASMRYWSGGGDTTVDVEEGGIGGASNYFDNVCPVVASVTRKSVQLDWLRHWWDYYSNDTDVDPGSRPTVATMMNELDAAPAWGPGTAWSAMRAGVKSVSGDDQQARWDQHGQWNGID